MMDCAKQSSIESESPIGACPWLRRSENVQIECGLLQYLTGLASNRGCGVTSDACNQCVRWYTPSADNLNPVVASLLYGLTSQILREGGRDGCGIERATELNQQALDAIPSDDDATPLIDFVQRQRNTQISDISQLIPRPQRRCDPRVREWAVAVTTAPRKQETLTHCLSSLIAAGWTSPRIFADGEVSIPETWQGLPLTRRTPQVGAWPSYYLGLIELVMRSPNADAYLILQDDVVLFRHQALKTYLEAMLWPGDRPGIVSLYCSRAYTNASRGWYELNEPLVWGGQALVFAREPLLQMLSDTEVVRHRLTEFGMANIDGVIGKWAFETNTPVYVSSPSLSQHIGHISSMWKTKAFANRSAAEFAGSCQL